MEKRNCLRLGLIFSMSLFCIWGCGVSKETNGNKGGAPLPDFQRPGKKVEDKDTLTLKAEELKLTHVTQAWKLNSLTEVSEAEKYLKLQKKFSSPIQFDGWVAIDRIEINNSHCAQPSREAPVFILEDDHGGAVPMQAGEQIAVSLEKLYVVRAELYNDSTCKNIDVQFGILYGTNE